MGANLSLKERKELFENAIQFKENKRPPLLSNYWSWKILDAGFKLSEGIFDYNKMELAVRYHQETYNWDAIIDYGWRNPLRVGQAMGFGWHLVDDKAESMTFIDHSLIESPEDYKLFLKDQNAFYWKLLSKCNPEMKKSQFVSGMKEQLDFFNFVGKMAQMLNTEYNTLIFPNYWIAPIEKFFFMYRGIKGLSADLRRYPELMVEVFDKMFELSYPDFIKNATTADTGGHFADLEIVMIAHSALSIKQFERFYYPYLKRCMDDMVAAGRNIFVFSEAYINRFAEYFQDIPKGHLMVFPEQDNFSEVRKLLPNACLAGGMPNELLGMGTPEDCVEYAKRLLDEMGNTGFVISQNKMGSFRRDGKRDNIKAVNEYILSL